MIFTYYIQSAKKKKKKKTPNKLLFVFAPFSSEIVHSLYVFVYVYIEALLEPCFSRQELVCLCGAQERQLRRAGQCGELPGAHSGPLPSLPAQLSATSDVSIRGA